MAEDRKTAVKTKKTTAKAKKQELIPRHMSALLILSMSPVRPKTFWNYR